MERKTTLAVGAVNGFSNESQKTKPSEVNMSIAPINKGILAKKLGTTQIFDQRTGNRIPVTILEVGYCQVVQKKSLEVDGYKSIQIGYGDLKKKNIKKPQEGHFKKAGIDAKRHLKELKFTDEVYNVLKPGDTLSIEQFEANEFVDLTASSKGKGFAGVMKRYNFAGRPATHGTHENFRGPGSVGMHQTPGRVIKGKKMPGHMGDHKTTVQNLQIAKVDAENNLIYIMGAVPGAKNALIIIRDSVKKPSEPYYVKGLENTKKTTESKAAESKVTEEQAVEPETNNTAEQLSKTEANTTTATEEEEAAAETSTVADNNDNKTEGNEEEKSQGKN
jgi:large subunit ribosomal protein L3